MKFISTTLALAGMGGVYALAIADPRWRASHWFCGIPGSSCVKRSAEPEAAAAPRTIPRHGFCGVPGASCSTLKRSAEAVRDVLADHWKNGNSASTSVSVLCNADGQKCDITNQAVADVSETAENAYHELLARRESPNKYKRHLKSRFIPHDGGKTWFCGVPGQSCGAKKRLASRTVEPDVDPASSNENALTEDEIEYLKAECSQEGHPCHSLLQAYTAFHQAKREVDGFQEYCSLHGCDEDTEEYLRQLQSGSEGAIWDEEDCDTENGECTLADRSFDALERSLDDALSRIA